MPIKFTPITPIEVRPEIGGDASRLVYATHQIDVEGKDNYYLLTDYMEERPALVAAEMNEDDLLVPVSEELSRQLMEYISPITLPNFPSYEEIKEALRDDRTIQ